jgi:hypothetical protein
MKKIINGTRYDTEKAVKVGNASSSCGRSDFRWWDETLYQTPRSKAFFLAGEGGPMTQWAEPCGNNARCEGSGIKPLTDNQALEWAEQNLDSETIEQFFADMIQDA